MSAEELRALHVPGKPLILPNAWDADTAKAVEAAGFPVVATSSAAVAAALGHADHEGASADEMLAAAKRIVDAVSVPVTVDAEAGYGLAPAELAARLQEIGAVGCNIEDTDHGKGGQRPAAEQAEWLAGLRRAAGDGLVVNARVDSFLGAPDEQAVLDDAVARGRAYLEAGADCVYPILVRSSEVLAEFVRRVGGPVNASALPGGPGLAGLAELGVARISLGAGLWRYLRGVLEGTLGEIAQGKLPY
ncbi:isocitrate lyase/phosphoenolpyruvate mutase family protein [Amycolatopsis sp. AA4]|uniref:isocitrate lyase/PEP mutase family protein n=1 Tax=Actinomycetes TaxID=1760 RepID=UPI0001B55529|nr:MULTISPECIES: isocitrate lyase/phosphoenolpyruvate mutase family protein [Actinomycetes]ATY10124.1 isocitrate lyase/phosphoenolpyruvate mutase family protein [Amycolatopsis sp. AA4]EFL05572.1 carboxyvinyl-carboxyphosphonate phosphorylmutase [Streptomyces sp. AA4]